MDKKSHPNGTGRFTFKIPMKDEGVYEIAIAVTKKGYDTKRFTYTVERFLTDEARQLQIRKQAARVGYGALTSRIDQYVGKVLTYSMIMKELWGNSVETDIVSLRVHMTKLRKKIGDQDREEPLIRTHVGIGYSMIRY